MSIKGDAIIIAVGAIALVAGLWYVKNKVTGAVGGVIDGAKDAMSSFDHWVDGGINSAGQMVTGDPAWTYTDGHSPQYNHTIQPNFGVLGGWDE
jgi:hypothetical protein